MFIPPLEFTPSLKDLTVAGEEAIENGHMHIVYIHPLLRFKWGVTQAKGENISQMV